MDTIIALGGADLVTGGPGADFIDVKDGQPDDVVCGDNVGSGPEGVDVIEADPGDEVFPGNC